MGKLWGRGCNQGRVWSCFKNSDRIEFSKLLCSFLLIWGCLFKFIISAWKLASKWPDMICGISVLFLLCFVLFFNLVCSFAAFSIWHCYDVIYVPVYIRGTHGFIWFLSALSFIQLVLFGTYKKTWVFSLSKLERSLLELCISSAVSSTHFACALVHLDALVLSCTSAVCKSVLCCMVSSHALLQAPYEPTVSVTVLVKPAAGWLLFWLLQPADHDIVLSVTYELLRWYTLC